MKSAFVFPGQGSQFVGMGNDLYREFSAARAVFEEVDDALNERLSKIIFDGDEEKLRLTVHAQPALMAVSMAVIKVLESEGFVLHDSVSYMAGHSLGEYSALCAAQMFSLKDTARLLKIRGEEMQKAVPAGQGSMAAIIGLENDVVEEICKAASQKGVCQIANDNGGGQIVISGLAPAVDFAVDLAKEHKAKRAILLPVSAPFHSILMEPAAHKMQEALAQTSIADPIIPVIINVRAEPVQNAQEILQYLVEQITGQVRWRESILWLESSGITELYEIGAGKVLSGLARRIAPQLACGNIGTVEQVQDFLKSLS